MCWCGCSIVIANMLCAHGHAVYDDNDELLSTQHASGLPAKRQWPAPGYPADWPRCPSCGDFALDGHITCGRLECQEANYR